MKKENRPHLSREERQIMYPMSSSGKSFAEIARVLNRHPTTISREVKRNIPPKKLRRQMTPMDRAGYAQEQAKVRQKERAQREGCLLDRRLDVQLRILILLEETNYSPEYIADIMSQSDLGVKLTGKTIRRWIRKNRRDFQKHFPHRGKRPRKHFTPKRGKKSRPDGALPKRSIHDRLDVANKRLRGGDFELDMVVCSQETKSILSIRDRKTRACWLYFVPDLKAETVRQAIIRFIHTVPPALRRTLTFDRGSEFSEVHQLEHFFGLSNYFCDAYCAWQKGSVENQNKELRRYIPKGTDLTTVSLEQLKRVEALLNAKPRPCLGGISASDAWFFESRGVAHTLH